MIIEPLFIGTSELLLIAALVLLLFGGKKLPEMMRGLGQGVKAFKEGVNEASGKTSDKTQNQEVAVNGDKEEERQPHEDGKE